MSLISRENRIRVCAVCSHSRIRRSGRASRLRRLAHRNCRVEAIFASAGRFEVTLPGMPTEKVGNSEDRPPVKVYSFSLVEGDTFYSVSYRDISANNANGNSPTTVLTAHRDGYAALGKVINDRSVKCGDHAGREFSVTKDGVRAEVKLVLAGRRLYTLMVIPNKPKTKPTVNDSDVRRFFDSFKISAAAQGPGDGRRVARYVSPRGWGGQIQNPEQRRAEHSQQRRKNRRVFQRPRRG